jgi:hypothetical protein
MADVEMKEAASSSKGKSVSKDSDKKKFEVKKVPKTPRHNREIFHIDHT